MFKAKLICRKCRNIRGNDTGFIGLLDPHCWKYVSLPAVTCCNVSCCKPDMGFGTGETVTAYALTLFPDKRNLRVIIISSVVGCTFALGSCWWTNRIVSAMLWWFCAVCLRLCICINQSMFPNRKGDMLQRAEAYKWVCSESTMACKKVHTVQFLKVLFNVQLFEAG